jgi:hypothetical protein
MRSMPEVETGEANRVWCDPNQATCVWAAVCSHDLHGHCGALWRRWCRLPSQPIKYQLTQPYYSQMHRITRTAN